MFDDSNIDQMRKASENLSNSCPVPVRNEVTSGSKLNQKGKSFCLFAVDLEKNSAMLIFIEATALLLVNLTSNPKLWIIPQNQKLDYSFC